MNTAALKAFAPAVRRQLLEAVSRKLDYVLTAQTPDYLTTYASQVAALRKLAQEDRAGLIERVAYTWFNRLTALRYLDARGWHPFRSRVLMAATLEETQPEVLKLMRTGALPSDLAQHTNVERLNSILDGRIPSADPQGEVYRHLVLAACHFYHALLPDVFERLDDETELLLPDDLLTEHSVAQPFRTEITDEDCAEVEIIGWLYQFYISERKDEVMARKSAVPKEDIPAVTQLFTPHWIVRYLVENSLGRLWLLNRPSSRLREKMPYYIEGEPETDFLRITRPEEIRILDPACGSGHMLTYAFDLLYAIYEEEGYAASDIPALILKNNLHGLDICPRAAQLAELALLFKAREKSRRFFQAEYLVRPNVMELREVRFAENELRDYIQALDLGELFNEKLLRLMYQFEEAKNLGSLIQPCLDEQTIAFVRGTIEAKDIGSQLFLHETHQKVLRVLEQAKALSERYQVVVANPPYLGSKGMNGRLKQYVVNSYSEAKADLFAAFVLRNIEFSSPRGKIGLITPYVWMFLSSYENFRRLLLGRVTITTLTQLEYNAFAPATIPVCTFTLNNELIPQATGIYIRLTAFRGADNQGPRTLEAINNPNCGWRYLASGLDFAKLPGAPIAYWMSSATRSVFRDSPSIGSIAEAKQGLITGDNGRFLRLWHEVELNSLGLGVVSHYEAKMSNKRWFPFQKGGTFRKWYGNHEFVVDWADDGDAIRNFFDGEGKLRSRPQGIEYYFLPGITWTSVTITTFNCRLSPGGFIYSEPGPILYAESPEVIASLAGFLNSKPGNYLLQLFAPGMHYNQGHVSLLPIPELSEGTQSVVKRNVARLTTIAKDDWNTSETSWEFCSLPLLCPTVRRPKLEDSYAQLRLKDQRTVSEMKALEEENNTIFIELYGLQPELGPDTPLEEVSLNCNPFYRYPGRNSEADLEMAFRTDTIKDFLSYAVGCMMGRYSLESPGLILVNAGDLLSVYLDKVGKPIDQLAFVPDEDGIIPVLDGEWFEDDIVARTREFLRATFGDSSLRDNIRFVEDSLGKDLRKYFLTEFYKDHLQTYKKRPIYWMVQSPRKSFSVLIYLHRYTRDTMNIVLNRYLRDFEVKLRNRVEHLARTQADVNANPRDKTAARKESDKLIKALHDCEEWERQTVLPLAQARIELDLDDGVKTNYLKLGEALAPIPGLAAAEE